ncbi:MAG: hypothetical protein R2857_07505 [Vampirovibrionales bacterium]
MRELTKQAANDTYGSEERTQIKNELDQLKIREIHGLPMPPTSTASNCLNGSAPSNVRIQIGSGNDTTATSTDVLDIASALSNLTASTGGGTAAQPTEHQHVSQRTGEPH